MLIYLEQIAKIAPLMTAGIAVIALLMARRQIKTVRQNEAKRQYSLFLLNSSDSKIEPSFVSGSANLSNPDVKSKYKMYLTSLMLAAEEVLGEFRGEEDYPTWRNALKDKLIVHRRNFDIIDRRSMDPPLAELVDEILAEYHDEPPLDDRVHAMKGAAA